jgi:hypothetical protein
LTDRVEIVGIDHVQLLMPTGGEEAARRFYGHESSRTTRACP